MIRKIPVLLLLLLLTAVTRGQEIKFSKIEPPFWFDGFKDPNLMLMVYGTNISLADFSVSAENIVLSKVVTLDSPDYVLLEITFTGSPLPEFFPVMMSSNKKMVGEYLFELHPGPASWTVTTSAKDTVFFSPSPAGFYDPPVEYSGNKLVFIADTLHKKNRMLVFRPSLEISPGNPWTSRKPVEGWITRVQTPRKTETYLSYNERIKKYMVQNALWWTEKIHPDAICTGSSNERDKALMEEVKKAIESVYTGMPEINNCK